jgi:hypothetical protein
MCRLFTGLAVLDAMRSPVGPPQPGTAPSCLHSFRRTDSNASVPPPCSGSRIAMPTSSQPAAAPHRSRNRHTSSATRRRISRARTSGPIRPRRAGAGTARRSRSSTRRQSERRIRPRGLQKPVRAASVQLGKRLLHQAQPGRGHRATGREHRLGQEIDLGSRWSRPSARAARSCSSSRTPTASPIWAWRWTRLSPSAPPRSAIATAAASSPARRALPGRPTTRVSRSPPAPAMAATESRFRPHTTLSSPSGARA